MTPRALELLQVLLPLLTPLATLAIVMVGFIYNNSRMSDLRSDMLRHMDALKETLRAEMAKNQSELLHKFADLDTRLSRLEAQR